MSKKFFKTVLVLSAILSLFGATSAMAADSLQGTFFTDAGGFNIHYTFGTSLWEHHMTVSKYDAATGSFEGRGYYVPNPCYQWSISGTAGATSSFKLNYDGSCSAGYYVEHDGSITAAGGKGNCWNTEQKCTWVTDQFRNPDDDCDEDGVPDAQDACVDCTVKGGTVNSLGCTLTQLCPCDYWTNHGEYVSCLANAKSEFVDAGLLTEEEAKHIVSDAAKSDCGHK